MRCRLRQWQLWQPQARARLCSLLSSRACLLFYHSKTFAKASSRLYPGLGVYRNCETAGYKLHYK
jgi:hypothetical protein